MSRHNQMHDGKMTVVVKSEIARVFWSRDRAWYGDDINLFVETRWVPDGTRVSIEARQHPPGEHEAYHIDLRGEHFIQRNRCVIRHVIRWEARSGVPAERPDDGVSEFVAIVRLDKLNLEAASNILYVDLPRFRLST